VKFLFFLGIGIFLFWWAYRDQDSQRIFEALKNADYSWLGISAVLSLLSHYSRALRWKILIKPLGFKPRTSNTFFAVMVMYLANLAFPRLGEVSRCGILHKYEKVPFTKLLGTVFIERIVDFLMLIMLTIVVLATQYGVIFNFISTNPEVEARLQSVFSLKFISIFTISSIIIFLVFYYFIRQKVRQTSVYKKTKSFVFHFVEGIKTILKLEQLGAFIFHTLFIYVLYFLMIYICFFAFEFTHNLSFLASLSVFVISSYGMVAPVNGGIGAWHMMAINTLFIYGVAKEPDGSAFAFAVHGLMTLLLIITGFISLVALPLINKKNIRPISND